MLGNVHRVCECACPFPIERQSTRDGGVVAAARGMQGSARLSDIDLDPPYSKDDVRHRSVLKRRDS
jgi:hypothetical protein